MKETQEKKLDSSDQSNADVGSDISSNYIKLRQNKIIIASIALLSCLLIFIFIISREPSKEKEEIKIEKSLKNKKDFEQGKDIISSDSIGDLGIGPKKNDVAEEIEDLSLKIPPLPELKIDIPSIKIEDTQDRSRDKDRDKEVVSEFESISDFNNTYDDVIVKNGKENKKEKEEDEKDKSKKKENIITDPRKTPIVLYGDSSGDSHPDSSMIHEDNIVRGE
jgi:hypothetical protein